MPTRAPIHQPRGSTGRKASDRHYDRRRGKTAARGYDGAWVKLRDMFLAGNEMAGIEPHPLCCRCGALGSKNNPIEVDHVIPISERPDLRLDPENLQAMCKSCHSRKTATEDGGFRGRGRGRAG